jgi:hypothetical protein
VVRRHPAAGEPERVRERLELTVTSVLADSVLELIRDRFDHVDTRTVAGPATVVTVAGIDQAGERALLNLLWDTGHEIGSMASSSLDP